MLNFYNKKYVYNASCPDRRDRTNPKKRFKFQIDSDTFLPIDLCKNVPIGGVVLCCAQHYAGYHYQTRRHSNDKMVINAELGEKIGRYLQTNYPTYLKDIEAWTKAINDAVDQTFNGTNNVWKGESPTPL
jgi:hypothetical protein